jgi:hypothetical protein
MIFDFRRASIASYVTEGKVEKGSKEPRRMVNKKEIPYFKTDK